MSLSHHLKGPSPRRTRPSLLSGTMNTQFSFSISDLWITIPYDNYFGATQVSGRLNPSMEAYPKPAIAKRSMYGHEDIKSHCIKNFLKGVSI